MSDLALIPQPVSIRTTGGEWRLPAAMEVAFPEPLSGVWPLVADLFGARLGVVLSAGVGAPDAAAALVFRLDHALGDGAYGVEVGERVTISAAGLPGAINGLRTVQQLLGPAAFRNAPAALRGAPADSAGGIALTIPRVHVEDAPRFGHRGVLLDVARHFLPKADVLRFIELASAHKLNVLHLHLTDDQGWRIQIDAFPRLTEVASWRTESQVGGSKSTVYDGTPHGGFYTKDDLREIVAYAARRGMTVIPEIDVPGHSQAAMAAYPELAASGEQFGVWTRWGLNPHTLSMAEVSLDFYRQVLDEVMEIFDSPVICLGGDETPSDEWAKEPASLARIAEEGLAGPDDLLGWFVGRLADHVRATGRRGSVWDEVEDIARDVIVNAWRAPERGVEAIARGHDVIMCHEHELYLNHRAAVGLDEPAPVGTVHTTQDVYLFEAEPPLVREAAAVEGAGRVLGAQAQLWTEQLDSARRIDYAAYPRLAAFAEAAWAARGTRDWDDFAARLACHLERLDAAGVEYRPGSGPKPWQRRPGVPTTPLRFDSGGTLVEAPEGER